MLVKGGTVLCLQLSKAPISLVESKKNTKVNTLTSIKYYFCNNKVTPKDLLAKNLEHIGIWCTFKT